MAALDTLILGPFVFTDFAVPDHMLFGGRQQMEVHKFPGGARVIDCMGPDDEDRSWTGIFFGDAALADAQTLDAMRRSGQQLAFSWGGESRTVVISEFHAIVQKFQKVDYAITVVTVDTVGGAPTLLETVENLVLGDLNSALALAA